MIKKDDICIIKEIACSEEKINHREILIGKRVAVIEAKRLSEESIFYVATVALIDSVPGYKNMGDILTFDYGVKLEKIIKYAAGQSQN